MSMAREAAPMHLAAGDVQRCEQAGGVVAGVVVGHARRKSRPHRQRWLDDAKGESAVPEAVTGGEKRPPNSLQFLKAATAFGVCTSKFGGVPAEILTRDLSNPASNVALVLARVPLGRGRVAGQPACGCWRRNRSGREHSSDSRSCRRRCCCHCWRSGWRNRSRGRIRPFFSINPGR
jgi:hypothetical protein